MLLAINKQNNDMVKFLWNDLRLLWDSFHLEYIIEEMSTVKYIDGIKLLLKSNTSQEIFMSMRAQDKISLLTNLLLNKQTKRSLEVKETLKEELTLHPYASVSLFVLINDPKNNFVMHAQHLERALSNIDPAEFARYKYTKAVAPFHEEVIKKCNEYASQEENATMKKFGEAVRARLEGIDQDIVKLKHGFVNASEYDDECMKLFDLAFDGELTGFKNKVTDNDIRFFRRKRLETVKLTPSMNVNRYSYFTPLLWAI